VRRAFLLIANEASGNSITRFGQGSGRFEPGGAVGSGIATLAQAKVGRVWFADDGAGEVRPVPLDGHNSDAELPAIVGNDLRELLFDRDGALPRIF